MDSWRAGMSQRERETLGAYNRGLENMSQQKEHVNGRMNGLLQRAHKRLEAACSRPESHYEEPSQREVQLKPDTEQKAEDAVLRAQKTADAEHARRLEELSQRETDIHQRLKETFQRSRVTADAEQTRRLEQLSQREKISEERLEKLFELRRWQAGSSPKDDLIELDRRTAELIAILEEKAKLVQKTAEIKLSREKTRWSSHTADAREKRSRTNWTPWRRKKHIKDC